MTTPVGRDVGESFETVRDTVVDLLLVGIGLVVGLANTLGDDLGIALAVACILAIGTLHAGRIFQEVAAKSATHNVVELLRNELVTLLLVDFFLLLTDGTLTVQSDVEWSSVLQLLGYKRMSVNNYRRDVWDLNTYRSSLTDGYGQQAPMQTKSRS